jgi:hypothetical protein
VGSRKLHLELAANRGQITRKLEVIHMPGKRGNRPSEVLLHISGKATYRDLANYCKGDYRMDDGTSPQQSAEARVETGVKRSRFPRGASEKTPRHQAANLKSQSRNAVGTHRCLCCDQFPWSCGTVTTAEQTPTLPSLSPPLTVMVYVRPFKSSPFRAAIKGMPNE